jgi:hypothetical protein
MVCRVRRGDGQIAEAIGVEHLEAGWLGANLLFQGYACLSQIRPTARLIFPNGGTLLVWAENQPCRHPSQVMLENSPAITPDTAKSFARAALQRRGPVGWVERAGIIHPGDRAEVYLP